MTNAVSASMNISLFGGLEISAEGVPLYRVARRYKAWELFVVLLLARGKPQRREYIAGLLWPDSDEARGLDSLTQALRALKESLQEHSERVQTHGRKELSLLTDGLQVDFWDYEDCVSRQHHRDALRISEKLFLAGWTAEWVISRQNEIEAARSEMKRRLTAASPELLPTAFVPPPPAVTNLHQFANRRASYAGEEARLIGRNVAEGADLLVRARTLGVIGVGGVGKTSFAIEVAHLLEPEFEGTFFVPLESLEEVSQVWTTIAEAIGLRLSPYDTPSEVVCRTLHSRKALLVLDNCEQLGTGVEGILAQLQDSCPALHFLATSRTRLERVAQNYQIEPLPEQDATQMLVRELTKNQYTGLTSLTDPKVASQLFDLHEGIPLFIEITGRLLLRSSLAELTQEAAIPRPGADQKGSQALWRSYRLLPDSAQTLFRSCAVLAGEFDMHGLLGICAGKHSERSLYEDLRTLADAFLVRASPDHSPARYRLLSPVREFASQLLSQNPDEDALVRCRHVEYCCSRV